MTSRGKDKYDHKVFNGALEARVQESRAETFKKKFPLRVQNDWSEHISSKGLIYYYNCRTEVSQWQKPDEWTLSSMPQEDIKKLLNNKQRNGENNKRNHPNQIVTDLNTSPKRIKYNNNQSNQIDKQCSNYNIPNVAKMNQKIEQVKNAKSINSISNTFSGINNANNNSNNNKCKTNEANFNNDDMDISPGSSPLSRGGSHSSDCEKKHTYFEFEAPTHKNQSNSKPKPFNKSWNFEQKVELSSPANIELSSVSNQQKPNHNQCITKPLNNNNNKYQENSSNHTSLTQFQISLAMSLRTTMNLLQSRTQFSSKDEASSHHSKSDNNNCLSVYHISDLLFRLEAVNNNGETANSYRSHRLQAQLSQSSNSFAYSNNNNDPKPVTKTPANINQIKELVKCLQDFIQENYPNSLPSITPVSPNYSKSNRMGYYLQILTSLIETCLMQLCPQSFNSPSSTSSPGSLKDNNSSISTSGTSQSYVETSNKPDLDSPIKKENTEIEKPKSILQDIDMVKYVSSDVTNSYRNQLADYYVQEAQVEYYKFVRLHSVLYAELACESKKLKALVRISEINTELLKQKKEDLEKLVQMLESRRLPSHLKCDYVPNS